MPTTTPAKGLPGIQALRAIAAIFVVIHHSLEESRGATSWTCPDWLSAPGAAGVDIFFVISGFIMVYVSFGSGRKPPLPHEFLGKRIMRIYPLYWLCAGAILLLKAAGAYSALQLTTQDALLSIFLLPANTKIMTVAWTLVFEIWFYIVFALALLTRSARATIIVAAAAIIAVLVLAPIVGPGRLPNFLVIFFSDAITLEFVMGMIVAYIYLQRPQLLTGLKWLLPPALVLISTAALFVAHDPVDGLIGLPRVLVWGVPAVVLVATVLPQTGGQSAWSRLWLFLGDASYAIYLTHPFVMLFYAKALKASPAIAALPQAPLIFAATLLSIAFGVVVHLCVERPIMTFGKMLMRSRPATA